MLCIATKNIIYYLAIKESTGWAPPPPPPIPHGGSAAKNPPAAKETLPGSIPGLGRSDGGHGDHHICQKIPGMKSLVEDEGSRGRKD